MIIYKLMDNVPHAALSIALALLVFTVVNSRCAGLNHIPGPWLARYTDALRAILALKYSEQDVNLYMKLHEQYGDIVRIGPRSVSVLDPEGIRTIYGIKARLDKGPNVNAFNIPGVPKSILATIDENTHAKLRKPIQGAYSLTNLKNYEPYVDETINILDDALRTYAHEKQTINLSLWVYYWSYDTIGKLTFGQISGYLTKGMDFNGLIHRQKNFLKYVNVTFDFIRFAQIRVDDRIAKYSPLQSDRPDLLSHFIESRDIYPDVVTNQQVLVYSVTNVIAGSLSTSHVLDEIVKFLTTNPQAQQRIYDELRLVTRRGNAPISFDDAKSSKYLEGIIFEGFRIHNVANLSSERVVGPEGMKLPNEIILPPGTYVGINPAAMNRRPDIFGAHPHKFDPLRWLKQAGETNEEHAQRRLAMDRATVTFGHGSRSCLGKNIVQLELFKLIATLCSRFTFEACGEIKLFKVLANVKQREPYQES